MPVEVEDAGLLPSDDSGGLVAISPGHGRAAGRLLQQIVVVRRRDGQAETADSVEDVPILQLQRSNRLVKPKAVFAAGGEAELA